MNCQAWGDDGCRDIDVQTPNWEFQQCFGERVEDEEIHDVDIISAIEFDGDGKHLATGDKGGRVVLFEQVQSEALEYSPDLRPERKGSVLPFEYKYYTEFQSHEPEFDYLKSLEIEEKINKVRWVAANPACLTLLSCNDKTIKLWRVHKRRPCCIVDYSSPQQESGGIPAYRGSSLPPASQYLSSIMGQPGKPQLPLKLPKVHRRGEGAVPVPRLRRVYSNAHTYHINSLSVNSDQQTFMSADDLRINIWNFDVTNQSFNIVDLKPESMDNLNEVLTCAEFHPAHCQTFVYGTSRGVLCLGDMRDSPLLDRRCLSFEVDASNKPRSFFSDVIASISDIKFSADGRYLLSRDYMTVKVWDTHMNHEPLSTFAVHDTLWPKMCELYENDCLFDKFGCSMSKDGKHIATGTYNNQFRTFSCNGQEQTVEATRDPMRKRGAHQVLSMHGRLNSSNAASRTAAVNLDYRLKLTHLAWHPNAPLLAVGAANSLYMFHGSP